MASRLRNKRCSNFTLIEERRLLNLVLKYKDKVENKRIDSESIRVKREAWSNIEEEFNYGGLETYRPASTLKMKYENCKKLYKVAMKKKCNLIDPDDKRTQKTTITNQMKEIMGDRYTECKSELEDNDDMECISTEEDGIIDSDYSSLRTINTAIQDNEANKQKSHLEHDRNSTHTQKCSCLQKEKHQLDCSTEEHNLNLEHTKRIHDLSIQEQNERSKEMKERHQLYIDEMKLKMDLMREEHQKKMELYIEEMKLKMQMMREEHQKKLELMESEKR